MARFRQHATDNRFLNPVNHPERVRSNLQSMRQKWRRVALSVIGLMLLVFIAAEYQERSVRRREQEFDRRMGRVRDGMTEAEVRSAVGVPDQTFDDPHRPDKGPGSGSCDNANAVASMLYSFDRKFWGMSVGGSSLVVCLDASRVVIDTHWSFFDY
jgi:hypothetical protein